MPDNAGASCSSAAVAGSNEQEDDSYLNELTEQYVARCVRWMDQVHKPQTAEDYAASLQTSQTSLCSRIAADNYQLKEGVLLNRIMGLDSHVFSCKWVAPGDSRLCFHVNFSARTASGAKRFFFAELTGTNCPEIATRCVMLTKFSVQNCKFCTGIWHPMDDDFLGNK